VGHHEATQTAAPQNAATDQHPHELALLAATALFTAVLLAVIFLCAASLLHAVAEQMRQEEATQAATTQHASADQHPHEPAVLATAALFASALVVLLLFVGAASLFHAVVEQVSHQEPTQAAAAYSAPDQHTNKSALLVTSFAAFAIDVGAFEDIVYGRCVIWHGKLYSQG